MVFVDNRESPGRVNRSGDFFLIPGHRQSAGGVGFVVRVLSVLMYACGSYSLPPCQPFACGPGLAGSYSCVGFVVRVLDVLLGSFMN